MDVHVSVVSIGVTRPERAMTSSKSALYNRQKRAGGGAMYNPDTSYLRVDGSASGSGCICCLEAAAASTALK